MKVYKLTIFGVVLFMMMQVGAKEYTQNTLPIPSVSSMSIEGETTVPVFHADTKTCELENFLVADRKATITVNLDEDYRPLWTDIIDAGMQIRHTIEKIEIIGMPLTKGKQAICFSFFLERTGEGEEYVLSNVEDNSLWLWGISPKCRIGYNPVVSNRCYSFEVKFPRGLEHHGRYLWTANLVYTQETNYDWGN